MGERETDMTIDFLPVERNLLCRVIVCPEKWQRNLSIQGCFSNLTYELRANNAVLSTCHLYGRAHEKSLLP